MSLFERYLTLWVGLCIVVGVALGHLFPAAFHAVGSAELAHVNLPVAILIWLMVIPMLMKVDFGAIGHVRRHWRGIGVTLFINWAVKPFSMAALGWLFIGYLFKPWLPAEQIDSYIAGLILLAAAPCTAMVFVWSNLSDGEPDFTLTQVALNDIDHGLRLRADRRAAARPLGHHRAVGDAAAVGRPLHRRAGGAGADPSPRVRLRARARQASTGCWRVSSRRRWSRCWPRWSCCSASRASRSSPSR